jgi:hypothetical protein
MRRAIRHRRDFFAGGLLILLGIGACVQGSTYKVGSLMRMGPGFMPVALGVVLVLLGILIAGAAVASHEGEAEHILPEKPEWLGWTCIIAGPILFIVLGKYCGLIPATFACVFVSALGDRSATLKGSLILAAGTTLFGALLFGYLLQIPFPLLRWGSL